MVLKEFSCFSREKKNFHKKKKKKKKKKEKYYFQKFRTFFGKDNNIL